MPLETYSALSSAVDSQRRSRCYTREPACIPQRGERYPHEAETQRRGCAAAVCSLAPACSLRSSDLQPCVLLTTFSTQSLSPGCRPGMSFGDYRSYHPLINKRDMRCFSFRLRFTSSLCVRCVNVFS